MVRRGFADLGIGIGCRRFGVGIVVAGRKGGFAKGVGKGVGTGMEVGMEVGVEVESHQGNLLCLEIHLHLCLGYLLCLRIHLHLYLGSLRFRTCSYLSYLLLLLILLLLQISPCLIQMEVEAEKQVSGIQMEV